jgi:hypothetical protein
MFRIRLTSGQELPFRLPAKVEEAYQVMYGSRAPDQARRYGASWRQQAQRTAWRILLTWVKGQLSLIALEMAKPEEVFLPYLLVRENTTLFEDVQHHQFRLAASSATEETGS